MKILLSLLLFALPVALSAQNQAKIDSLTTELNRTTNDSLKIEIKSKLFSNYYQYDPPKAREIYLELIRFSHGIGSENGLYKGFFAAGSYHAVVADFDSSLFYFNKAYEIADKLKNNKLKVESLLGQSHIHLWKNELRDAKGKAIEGLAIAEKSKDETNVALSFKKLGEIYNIESNRDSAVIAYLNAIRILETNQKAQSKLGDLYVGIGEVYLALKQPEKQWNF